MLQDHRGRLSRLQDMASSGDFQYSDSYRQVLDIFDKRSLQEETFQLNVLDTLVAVSPPEATKRSLDPDPSPRTAHSDVDVEPVDPVPYNTSNTFTSQETLAKLEALFKAHKDGMAKKGPVLEHPPLDPHETRKREQLIHLAFRSQEQMQEELNLDPILRVPTPGWSAISRGLAQSSLFDALHPSTSQKKRSAAQSQRNTKRRRVRSTVRELTADKVPNHDH